MPEYVALHSRKTAYIGLMKNEIEQCIEGTVKICPIRKPIYPVKKRKRGNFLRNEPTVV